MGIWILSFVRKILFISLVFTGTSRKNKELVYHVDGSIVNSNVHFPYKPLRKFELFFKQVDAKRKAKLANNLEILRRKRDEDVDLFRTNRDSIIPSNNVFDFSKIVRLDIETDDDSSSGSHVDDHAIRAKYVRSPTVARGEREMGHHYDPKWRKRLFRNNKTLHTEEILRNAITSDLKQMQRPEGVSDKGKAKEKIILRSFLNPTEGILGTFLTNNINNKFSEFNLSALRNKGTNEFYYKDINNAIGGNKSDKEVDDVHHSSIESFFAEENKVFSEEENFHDIDAAEADFVEDEGNNEPLLYNAVLRHNIPILSGLIQGTLNQEMDARNEKLRQYLKDRMDKLNASRIIHNNTIHRAKSASPEDYNNTSVSSSIHQSQDIFHTATYNTPASKNNVSQILNSSITSSVKMELEDPDTEELGETIHSGTQQNIPEVPAELFTTLMINNFAENNEVRKKPISNAMNQNEIEFITVDGNNSFGVCMDGSLPGYYLRKGLASDTNKWIIHLHGGAWCYDLHSCIKRRSTILGSTLNSRNEDMDSFFHGILSKYEKINPYFFTWNVAVLSYCDGGLFSGNRRRPLTGKGKKFYFQGRSVLRSLIEHIKTYNLHNASEVILSGTSAGGLAIALQGDFLRKFIPPYVKVRGLIDAGIFLDKKSIQGNSIARQQFRALYSLHRPLLNEECLANVPRKERYICLFPEYTIKYMKLPIYVVNSLYDHWQLSYLEGLACVYDERKCETREHDHILNFRNQMYSTLREIAQRKNTTGVFANSCLAHGQVILDYTWTKVKINDKSIARAFYDWYQDLDEENKHFSADCKYPCNGSCPKQLAQKCVKNFKGASENRRRREAEIC